MKEAEGTFAAFLEGHSRKEVIDFARVVGLDLGVSVTKSAAIKRYTDYILSRPGEWMSALTEWDLKILRTLAAQAPGEHMAGEYAGYIAPVTIVGIVQTKPGPDDDTFEYWLPEELFFTVKDNIDAAIRDGESSGRFTVERLALGLLNLYGFMPMEKLLDMVMEYLKEHPTQDIRAYYDFFVGSAAISLFREYSLKSRSEVVVCPELFEIDTVESGRDLYSDIRKAKHFSYEEVLEAGTGAPDFTFRLDTPEGRRYCEVLLSKGYYPESIPMLAHDLWMGVQIEGRTLMDTIYGPVADQMDMFLSEEEYHAALEAVADYVNILPRWQLKGWSPAEKNYMKLVFDPADAPPFIPPDGEYDSWEMPRPSISEGYTDLIEKDEKIGQLIGLMPEGFPFGMAIPHVSKDDPCPCGSGLKYGSCHGKMLN